MFSNSYIIEILALILIAFAFGLGFLLGKNSANKRPTHATLETVKGKVVLAKRKGFRQGPVKEQTQTKRYNLN